MFIGVGVKLIPMPHPTPDADKISTLLTPFGVTLAPAQLAKFAAYLDLLVRWNAKINLTAVRGAEQMVTRHFGESLFAAKLICETKTPTTLFDLGSGAGFPGVPFAIYSPATQVTLIESQQKKATFLKETSRMLGLANVTVHGSRGEEFTQRADVVTMRAVEQFEQSARVAWNLVSEQGRLALLIGGDQQALARLAVPIPEWEAAVAIPGSTNRVVLMTEPG